jgi:hypothetical protein
MAAGWDHGEEISGDENSESSDEYFECRMATDTDHEDIAMLQAEIWDEEREDDRPQPSPVFVPIQWLW